MKLQGILLALVLGITACSGTDGTDGEPGPAGAVGEQGEPGEQGAPGEDGEDGEDGTDGIDGMVGPQGPEGPEGPEGPAGEPGASNPEEEPTPPVIGSVRLFQAGPTGIDTTVDIVGFDFSITNTFALGSATGGAGGGRAQIQPLFLRVAADEDVSEIQRYFFEGRPGSLELTLAGETVPTLSSGLSAIAMIEPTPERTADQSYVFEIVVDLADVTVRRGTAEATWNEVTNRGTCTMTPCGCANLSPLTYVHDGEQMLNVAQPNVRLDSFATDLARVNDLSGRSGSKIVDGGTTLVRPFGEDAICDFVSVGFAQPYDSGLTIHHASPLSEHFGPLYDHSIEMLCLAATEGLRVFSNADGEVKAESVHLSGAQTHTFRTFDETDGSEVSSTSNTWNFIRNSTSTQCP